MAAGTKRARSAPDEGAAFRSIAYIGAKRKLADSILDLLEEVWPDARRGAFHDAFAGGGSMAFHAAKRYSRVVCNDQELYACAVLRAMGIAASGAPAVDWAAVTSAPGDGYVERELCTQRRFFTPENGRVIDSVRAWLRASDADERTKAYVLGVTVVAADRVANTTGVYGAYLKQWCARSLKPIRLDEPLQGIAGCTVTRGCAAEAVERAAEPDVVYCDPPYTARSYSKNYHVLNIIANVSENAELTGTSGIPATTDDTFNLRSAWNNRKNAVQALKALLTKTGARRIVMSYSTDGLMTANEIQTAFHEAGWRGTGYSMPHKRYWAGHEDGHKNTSNLCELLFVYERARIKA